MILRDRRTIQLYISAGIPPYSRLPFLKSSDKNTHTHAHTQDEKSFWVSKGNRLAIHSSGKECVTMRKVNSTERSSWRCREGGREREEEGAEACLFLFPQF